MNIDVKIIDPRIAEQLPAYAPDPNPAPLKDEAPDPQAVKGAAGQGTAPDTAPRAPAPPKTP